MVDLRTKDFVILAPTDFSEQARDAVARAIDLANALNGSIVLLHVSDARGLYTTPDVAVDMGGVADELRTGARASLGEIVRKIDPDRRRVRGIEIRDGAPATTIVDCAGEVGADMIVMGTHGRTGFSRFFLGSVAERVVRLAPCDVLVVHAPRSEVPL